MNLFTLNYVNLDVSLGGKLIWFERFAPCKKIDIVHIYADNLFHGCRFVYLRTSAAC